LTQRALLLLLPLLPTPTDTAPLALDTARGWLLACAFARSAASSSAAAVTAAVAASSKPSSTSSNAVAGAVAGREDAGAVVGGGRDSESRARAGDWDEILTAAARRRASAA
jgi:hypothetical protein